MKNCHYTEAQVKIKKSNLFYLPFEKEFADPGYNICPQHSLLVELNGD